MSNLTVHRYLLLPDGPDTYLPDTSFLIYVFLFGAMLGVPVSQLKKIELDHQTDSDRCKLELLQYWLDNNLGPFTWNEIVQALEKTDQLAFGC